MDLLSFLIGVLCTIIIQIVTLVLFFKKFISLRNFALTILASCLVQDIRNALREKRRKKCEPFL
jgi:hypothetical protein